MQIKYNKENALLVRAIAVVLLFLLQVVLIYRVIAEPVVALKEYFKECHWRWSYMWRDYKSVQGSAWKALITGKDKL